MAAERIASKMDMYMPIASIDKVLGATTKPRHRAILENYRRHVILELTGEWEGIFTPEMTVDVPVYYFCVNGENLVVKGEDVRAFYRNTRDSDACVSYWDDAAVEVTDAGVSSVCTFQWHGRGHQLLARGIKVDDPEGYYAQHMRTSMFFFYNDRVQLIGEHVIEDPAHTRVVRIQPEEFLTLEDSRARLLPLLRPLPALAA